MTTMETTGADAAARAGAAVRDKLRLEAVRSSKLLDSAPEESFDRLTRLAARLTGAPVTFISVVDEDRDFYKACYGFPEPLASERQLTGTTFCHYAIASSEPLVIEDTLASPTYRNVPTVQSLGVRAYLGIPLKTSSGQVLGSFCAIDFAPRQWSPLNVEVMEELATSTMREIELRAALDAASEAQHSLAAERRLLDAAVRQMPAGVMVAAPDGKIVLSNARATEILGTPIQDLNVASGLNAKHPDGSNFPVDEWPLVRALRKGEVVVGERMILQRGETTRTISINAAPVRDGEELIAAVVAFEDVTEIERAHDENQRLYEEAASANRAKDEFFAAVTHELRTPMTSIIGWTRILKMEQLDSPDAIEAAAMIESSAHVQARLVDDLLDVSRISSGKIQLERVQLDLAGVIDEAVRAAEPAASAQGVSLRSELQPGVMVDADRSRLRQIFGNLLSNAIKFTPAGGLVEVSSRSDGSTATVKVSDTGRGISAELLPHIFDRGRQAYAAEYGGLGLGLTIVRQLTEMHGGTVRAESEGTGRGASFVVTLPVAN